MSEPVAIGRPSDFTQEIADTICERIADGESLRSICNGEDMPNKATVFRWLAVHDVFRDQYARARETQADALFDDVLAIADQYDSASDAINPDLIQRAKLRIDTRKWMAGKLRPKKYGDKIDVEHSGQLQTVTRIELVAPET
ncbi:hypothetical protein CN204_04265 [Sinorhizobium meliloti]|uniref:terminase small subunit-like protein n=1 Tax=Rhizobium meliloti TaxID=382 RepID=UPI000FDA7D9C|nr:hypothetical protein [Sinorhizobium meliloti]RVH87752.1 hypothetical protein CN204_04265 [Sinorhizobium meliloti]